MTAKDANEAVSNANGYHTYESGMCLKWVRSPCWELPGLYASAIDAWNGARHKHPGDRTPPKGAPCFYRGGNYGHIVIFTGSEKVRSTDCTSKYDVSAVDIGWCERSWGYDYLGWTEDLNGVMLPLGGEEDDMKQEDFDKIRSIVKDEIKKGWEWEQANDNSRAENLNLAGRAAKKTLDNP